MSDFLDEEMLWGKSQIYEDMKKNSGICADCGKPFEQGFRINQKTGEKIFNKFKYCPKCRSNLNKKSNEEKVENVSIKYDPYPWQKKFHKSPKRFKVISGAARAGKDRACTMEFTDKFVEMLNEDRDYTFVPKVHGWVVAPTFRLGSQNMREIFNTFPRQLVTNFDKENLVIETINGGLIEFRSADDPDSLVSVGLDIVWITEAARIKKFDVVIGNITDRLDSPGRGPNGTGGLALINSSPRGRTYFNEVCRWGVEGGQKQRPNWETFYISRWDNPDMAKRRYQVYDKRIDKWVDKNDDPYLANERTYEEDLMLSRSDRQYREDILGLPSDDAGSQFPNFRENAVIELPRLSKEELREYKKEIQTPKSYFTYSIGYDPAKSIDGACIVVYCENTGEVVELLQLEKVPYTVQINVYLKELVKKWNYAIVRYGKTGLGEALEDIFKLAGIAYIPYPEQGHNKEKLVENLTALVKADKFKIHNINDIAEKAIRQFEDYGFDISEKGKNVTYSNMTLGGHDDFVSASYFAVADVTVNELSEIIDFNSDNNFMLLNNKYSMSNNIKNNFF